MSSFPEESARARSPMDVSGKATASLILGLLSIVCFPLLIPAFLAIILGVLGILDIGKSEGRMSGQGRAIAGIVLGVVGLLVITPFMSFALLLPAIQRVRSAAQRTIDMQNMQQMGIAMLQYHEVHGRFPPQAIYDKDGKPLLSWRVAILPYLERQDLYQQFKLDEPWDSPHNIALLPQMPQIYALPGTDPKTGQTHYQVFVGKGTMFDGPQGIRLAGVSDGVSNTILVVDAASTVPWTKPEDLPFEANAPLPVLGSRAPGEFNAIKADGGVVRLYLPGNEQTIRAMITRNGNELVDFSKTGR